MRALTALVHLTLDGVMQAPGRPDEDTRDGFTAGGWSVPYGDRVMGEVMGRGMASGGDLLLGRRTYEDFAAFWPHQEGNPFTPVLNAMVKHVVSRTLREPLGWENSRVVPGEAAQSVAALKEEPGADLCVLGSGELLRNLLAAGLVDELLLPVHPLVLGSGRRLFEPGGPRVALRLVESIPTTTGVVIARYRPERG